MKRKFLMTLSCVAVCTALLCGCGQKEDAGSLEETVAAAAAGDGTGSAPSAGETDRETAAASEYLSTGKKILYRVDTLDKAAVPSNVYFFEDGQVACLGKAELDLTMGELSQMTDDEIWAELDRCREEKYSRLSGELEKEGENRLQLGLWCLNSGMDTGEYASQMAEALIQSGYFPEPESDVAYGSDEDMRAAQREEAAQQPGGVEKVEETGDAVYGQIEEILSESKEKSGSFPTAFILETDSTGNSVVDECVVWVDMETETSGQLLLGKMGGTGQIYESTYVLYPDGRGNIICARDSVAMAFDGLGSDGVHVDVPTDFPSVKELFQ